MRRVHRGRLIASGALAAALFALVLPGFAPPAGAVPAATAATGRVLVISLPSVEWADFETTATPNLDRLFTQSSIGAMVTNGVDRPTSLPAGYATLGAGARATANSSTGGEGFAVDEQFGRDPAGVVFTTRTGVPAGNGLVYMPITDTLDANDSELYGAKVGLLGDQLAAAGISRAVIANGDGTDPSTPQNRYTPYRRAAVAALMTSAGKVPAGEVDHGILRADPTAPFGVRLDQDHVVAAFRAAWRPRSVVLVEGSDLVRADLAAQFASDEQGAKIRADALRSTDRLVGRLLHDVGPDDQVMVVGPTPPADTDSLTVASVRGPGFVPGLLRSTTTQRDGFVNITDVAPTILRYFGIDRPDDMEGRRMETGATGASLADRTAFLTHVNTDGVFRDSLIGASMGVIVGVAAGLAIAAALVDRWRRGAGLLAFGALWLLGYLDATYLAGPFHFGRHGGLGAYWAFVVGVGAVIALACMFVTRRRPVDSILVGLGAMAALHLVDLVTGAHLEWNTVFGYSPTIGIRFVGEGNLTFAQLSASVLIFVGLLAWRVPTRRGIRVAVALLAVTVLVIGVPFWGNDFGGAVSAAPGFALLAWLLLGRKLRWRTVFGLAGVLVASAVLVGLVDLLRPSDERTHVGKFFEQVFTNFDAATLVIRRKASENLSAFGHSLLLGCIIILAVLVAYLVFVPPKSIKPLLDRVTTARPIAISLAVVAVLGFALNDSGITIPGMMAAVLESAVVVLLARVVWNRSRSGPPEEAPDDPVDEELEPPVPATTSS
jgi:hypothetical protein